MTGPDETPAPGPQRPHRSLRALAGPIAWSLYLAVPVSAWPWLDGLPLGPLDAGAIALMWWVWAANRHMPAARTLAALTMAKLAVGALLVPGGFTARYYANDTWSPPVEQSLEFRRSDLTRLDAQLAFGGSGQPDLPLHFLNHKRFNFYQPTEPRRDQLAYSVIWTGWIEGDASARPQAVYLTTSGGVRGEIAIDGRPVVPLSDAAERTGEVALSRSWHAVTIRIAAPQGSGRRAEAGEVIGGERRPFDEHRIFPRPAGMARRAVDTAARWLARGIDLFVLSWLGVLVVMRARADWRHTRVGRLLWCGAIVEALLFALPYASRVVVLTGGDDWLSYEHLARAIALGDPLLRRPGIGAGQGTPFYYQPLYPYFVALTHVVFGDGLFGAVLVQRMLLAATIGWVTSITTRLFGGTTGWVALVGGGLFMYEKGGRWTEILLAEPLFTPLLACWTWLLVRTATDAASWTRWGLTGLVGGVATLTRSTLLLGWPLLMMAWSASLRVRRLRMAAVVVAIMIAVVSTATLRNWVVAGAFVPIASSGAVNLALGNTPPRPLSPTPAHREAVYDRFQLSGAGRMFLEFAMQMPRAFVANLGRKALYSVGFFERSGIGGAPGTSFLYVGMWCAALAGAIRIMRSPQYRRLAVVALPGLAALSHFVAVVLFFPNVYADRLILPLYPLLVPYAAYALVPLVERVRTRADFVNAGILAALASCMFVTGLPRVWDLVTLVVLGAVVIAITSGPRPRITLRGWLYVGYVAAGVAAYAMAQRQGSGAGIDFRSAFLLPLAVFAVAQLGRTRAPYFAALGTAAVGAVVAIALLGPAIPDVSGSVTDVIGDWSDVSRDARNIVAGNPDARQELADDVREMLVRFIEPTLSAFKTATEPAGIVAGVCLLGIWLQALLVSGRATVRRRSAGAALCCAALAATLVIFVSGVAPARWGAGSYSLAVLAVLFGLAESRAAEGDARRVDSPTPPGEDKMLG